MIATRNFCLILLIFIFVEIKHITSRGTKNSRKKEIVKELIKRKSAEFLDRKSNVNEKNGKSGVFHLGYVKPNAWKFRPTQKDVHGMKKSDVLQPNFNQKDKTSALNTRGPTSNIITDLKVPKMGPALQWFPDNSNNSKDAADNATQGQQNGNADNNVNDNNEVQVDAKVKNLLDALDDASNAAFNSTVPNNVTAAFKNGGVVLKDTNAQKKQIIGPGYYEPECDDKKKCPDDHYCHHFVCVECHRNKHACTFREQCCNNMECVYGRCEQKPKGSPGAFCHKDKDCAGHACCVLEPTVDEDESICKPKLSEYHQCSPILFRKVWIGDNKPECGPCKDGLKCMQKGNEGNHEVCMKET